MNPEEIQEQIVNLEQRISQRIQILSSADPQMQRLMGQVEVYKIMSEEPLKPKEGKK